MRNHSLDVLKAISAFAVVFIHFQTDFTAFYLPFLVFAVPVFFMISGFLIYEKESRYKMITRIKRSIARVLYVFVFSGLVYILFYGSDFSFMTVFQIVVYNLTDFSVHLWYLPSYIYVLLVCLIWVKCDCPGSLYYLIPILLLIGFSLSSYSVLLFNKVFPNYYSRNFLFTGLPFFFLGMLIKQFGLVSRIKEKCVCIGFLISILFSFIEYSLLSYYHLLGNRLFGLSTLFLALFIFLFVIQHNGFNCRWLAYIGHYHSLAIYIFHPLIYSLLSRLFGKGFLTIILTLLFIIFAHELIKYASISIKNVCQNKLHIGDN